MIITTPSPTPAREARRSTGGFTLVEVMIGAGLSAFILAGVLSSFLFLGRSGANIQNYSDMESQARKALELFAEDTRQASNATWTSSTSVSLTVNGNTAIYTYSSGTFQRRLVTATSSSTTTLLTGIQEPTTANPFFRAYTITGTQITDFSTASARTTASNTTKQIQISLSAIRKSTTVASATNIVLSARYVLRNKRVTA